MQGGVGRVERQAGSAKSWKGGKTEGQNLTMVPHIQCYIIN